MENIIKYKHYLLFLVALILLNFVISPLFLLQEQQKEKVRLLERKLVKTESLINNKDLLTKQNEIIKSNELLIPQFAIRDSNKDNVKLSIQKKVEEIIAQSSCDLERVSFKGEEQLSELLTKWRVELRYKGDINCLMKATRAIELNTPLISIDSYVYNGGQFKDKEFTVINAKLILNFFQYISLGSES